LVLLCCDGSPDSLKAITAAGRMLAPRRAVVLTVWEPVSSWEPYDPATILTAPLTRLADTALGLDEIMCDLARERMERGVKLAKQAGFEAEGRLAEGKPWRMICEIADELHADPIVLGARGLGRVQSQLLGSVSSAVAHHANRPVLVIPHRPVDDRAGQ
jgi:nucleotide-binding universal stress UspA family protein